MKIVFAGTPSIAVPSLKSLIGAHDVVTVLTAPDNVQSRKPDPDNSAVKNAALEAGLSVMQPLKLDAAVRESIAALKPDLLVCFAYGMIFGPKFLALFPKGGVNIHPSLLPQFRGPSPISAAILAGLHETGISIQRLALEMDAGDILKQERFTLNGNETTASLTRDCADRAAVMLPGLLADIAAGSEKAVPQDDAAATYCRLIQKEEGRVDWAGTAVDIERAVRAYDPWPRAWTTWDGKTVSLLEAAPFSETAAENTASSDAPAVPGTVLKVDKKQGILIQTGTGLLAVRRLQLQGKKEMDFQSFVNGARNFLGSLLGGQLP